MTLAVCTSPVARETRETSFWPEQNPRSFGQERRSRFQRQRYTETVMSLPLTHRVEGRVSQRLLLPPPRVTRVLLEERRTCQVAVVSPLPGEGRLLSPGQLTQRAIMITALMEEILSRTEAVPHGGINE